MMVSVLTHDVIVLFSGLGVAGQVLVAIVVLFGVLEVFGVGGPLRVLRAGVAGYELWLAFVVAAIATGGSLFFSEIAHFVPCELCWFQRICMYPLSITTLLMGLANDYRAVRYLLPTSCWRSTCGRTPARCHFRSFIWGYSGSATTLTACP